MGGLSQANIQSHADEMRMRFARQVAEELDRLVARTGATRLILAGDEVAIPHLRNALSTAVANLVHDETLRIDIRASQDTIQGAIDPLLLALEASDALAVADRLIGEIRADGLGAAGQRETRAALEQGQVDTLLLDPTAALGAEERSELVGLATRTGGMIEIVEGHEAFAQLGGVGALLRYRIDWAPHTAPSRPKYGTLSRGGQRTAPGQHRSAPPGARSSKESPARKNHRKQRR